ncbi:MBL fold metallo-hydrolase [Parasphingorhabdus sp.]|jgi:glyoxylase-like metal-dependent hydrolase (beta-lactamase superfamily II)|uniref:MBL fold metallo-hydrolase n=1 Tax=Parasphingorhabdus sp. TaxID=2709688 RepID=UPI003002AD03|tara:strand:- start:753 stop:1661 length:909 start_codon:yes stop_codon:yes gene_type:complete
MTPNVQSFFDDDTNTISYVVSDPATGACAIIDPVLNYDAAAARTATISADRVIDHVRREELNCEWVLETHVHADHLSAAPYVQGKLGGKLAIGDHITITQSVFGEIFNAGPDLPRDGSQFDQLFHDGDSFPLGKMTAHALHTPGHTPACMTYVIGDAAFVGDTMFMPDYGTARADFPGGDARILYRSIRKIFTLPGETRLFMCHDYLPEGRSEHRWETTVAEQKAANIHIHDGVSEDEFVTMREARDAQLGMPKLILPSIQVNIRAGYMPPAEDNGTVYLKLPVNIMGEPQTPPDETRPGTQ